MPRNELLHRCGPRTLGIPHPIKIGTYVRSGERVPDSGRGMISTNCIVFQEELSLARRATDRAEDEGKESGSLVFRGSYDNSWTFFVNQVGFLTSKKLSEPSSGSDNGIMDRQTTMWISGIYYVGEVCVPGLSGLIEELFYNDRRGRHATSVRTIA